MAIVNKRETAVEYYGQTKEAQESGEGRAWWEERVSRKCGCWFDGVRVVSPEI